MTFDILTTSCNNSTKLELDEEQPKQIIYLNQCVYIRLPSPCPPTITVMLQSQDWHSSPVDSCVQNENYYLIELCQLSHLTSIKCRISVYAQNTILEKDVQIEAPFNLQLLQFASNSQKCFAYFQLKTKVDILIKQLVLRTNAKLYQVNEVKNLLLKENSSYNFAFELKSDFLFNLAEQLLQRTEKEYAPSNAHAKAVAAALGYDLAYQEQFVKRLYYQQTTFGSQV